MTHHPFFSSPRCTHRRHDWIRGKKTLFMEEPKICQFREILFVSRNSLFLCGKMASNLQPGDKCGIAVYGESSILLWICSLTHKTGKGRSVSKNAIDK